MRRAAGWRSARSSTAAAASGGLLQRGRTLTRRALARTQTTTPQPQAPGSPGEDPTWPWQGVRWDLSYVGFLAYVAAIVTYAIPIAREAMVLALLGLPFAKGRLRFPAPFLCLLAFACLATVGYFASPYQYAVEPSLQELWRVVAIIFVAVNVLTDRPRARFFVFFYLACFALFPVRGAIFNQFIYHAAEEGRIAWNNIFGNPNDLAAFLFLPMGLAAGLLTTEREKRIRTAALVGLALLPLIVFLTQSRGAIIALAVGIVVSIIGHRQRAKMLLALSGVAVVVVVFAPDGVWSRMQNLGSAVQSGDLGQAGDRSSAKQRFDIWLVAIDIIAANPVAGVGYGAYEQAHREEARRGGTAENLARGWRDAHSTYLETTAETGLVGLAVWATIFVTTIAISVSVRRRLKRLNGGRERQLFFVEVALLAYGIAAVFGSYQRLPFTYLHVAVLWALASVASDGLAPNAARPSRRRG